MEAKELLDSLDVGVAAMAPDWTIAEWSAAAARIIAVPPERVLGQSIWTAFPAAKGTELERVFGEVFADGKPRTFLAPAGAPESPGTLLVNVDPVRAAPKLLFLALDVSREILLQQRLLQADRLSQLGALVSGVAHELNNPLAAIAAFGEALALDPHQADLAESAEVIRSEAMRAGRIVQTLLDFARQRPRMKTAVDLGEIAERVLALQRSALKKARIRATISIANDVPAVAGDPQELQQVMLNAVVNARQAIESTGRPGLIAVTARSSDHHVLVTVDDTGPGVPPEILDRVFEPFFSTKAEHGTGLGLAISFGLVRGMGG